MPSSQSPFIIVSGSAFETFALVKQGYGVPMIFGPSWGSIGELLGAPNEPERTLPELLAEAYDSSSNSATIVLPAIELTPARALALAIVRGAVANDASTVEQIAANPTGHPLVQQWNELMGRWAGKSTAAAWTIGLAAWAEILPLPADQAQSGCGTDCCGGSRHEKPAQSFEFAVIHECPSGVLLVVNAIGENTWARFKGSRAALVAITDLTFQVQVQLNQQVAETLEEGSFAALETGLTELGFTAEGNLYKHASLGNAEEARNLMNEVQDLSHNPFQKEDEEEDGGEESGNEGGMVQRERRG